jgi:hypothetical protein
MHLYYEYPNSGSALTASADVYDLNAPPRDQRLTIYAYSVFPHTGSTDPRCVVQYEDEIQLFITGSVFNGITSYTEAEAIAAGFDVGDEESEDLAR